MLKKKGRAAAQEINASSMADIAFLLLIFFLVTTTIASDKGLRIILPPKREKEQRDVVVEVNKKNVYTILVNSRNQLLVEEESGRMDALRKGIKKFVTNNGKDPESSDNPQEAVVSYKTDRATQYKTYLRVLDEIKGAYNELRAEFLKMPLDEYLKFNEKKAMDDPILVKKAQNFAEAMQEPASVRKYLNVNHKKDPKGMSDYERKRIEAYKQARASAKELFIEKYFDAKLEYPERISEAEPTKVEE